MIRLKFVYRRGCKSLRRTLITYVECKRGTCIHVYVSASVTSSVVAAEFIAIVNLLQLIKLMTDDCKLTSIASVVGLSLQTE